MNLFRQPVCQRTKKPRYPPVGEKVEIVQKEKALPTIRQLVAEVVNQKAPACRIRRAGVVFEKGKAGSGKGRLDAFPENGQMI